MQPTKQKVTAPFSKDYCIWVCGVCHQQCSRKANLERHKNVHIRDREN
jgi:hypothetical protein